MRLFATVLSILCVIGSGLSAAPQGRGLLWRAVQSCILNHSITGASFPCETVDISAGRDKGYAVLRAPLDDAHVVVTPTVRTIGIEADRLRGPDAPNYFQEAWLARHFATDVLSQTPGRDDYAMAVNSRPGRSQDQLHIHVACVRQDVKQTLADEFASIRAKGWKQVKLFRKAPLYWAHFEPVDDLADANVVDLVAHGLGIKEGDMSDVTIAVVGAKPNGFFILARRRIPKGYDEPHAEALLDRGCSSYAKK